MSLRRAKLKVEDFKRNLDSIKAYIYLAYHTDMLNGNAYPKSKTELISVLRSLQKKLQEATKEINQHIDEAVETLEKMEKDAN